MGKSKQRICPVCTRRYPTAETQCPYDQTDLVTMDDGEADLIGRTIAHRFTLKSLLGRGGMGSVYRAVQHSVGRDVAVKVIRGHYAANETAVKRFVREAHLASRIAHPNTVTIFDFGQTQDGLLFLVMEMLNGESLRQRLRGKGRFDMRRVLGIAAQVADGLDAAHRLGIVHRDLKPANIILLDDNQGRDLVKILDFGLARTLAPDQDTITQEGNLVGTIGYMAPEIISQGQADGRSDLYSLGIMLYELLAGTRPYVGKSPAQILLQHLKAAAAPFGGELAVAKIVERFVLRLMAKDPEDRYETAAVVRDRALRLMDTLGGTRLTHTLDGPTDTSVDRPLPSLTDLDSNDADADATAFEGMTTAEDGVGQASAPTPPPGTTPGLPALSKTAITPEVSRAREGDPTALPTTQHAADRPSTPLDPRQTNLCRRLDAFVGRRIELATLNAELAQGDGRLVTLMGPGGTGKTRLAQRFAEGFVRTAGSAWFCDLTEARSLDDVVSAVAGGLEVPLRGADPIAQLGNAIAGRGSVLILLDNFEQVIEHGAATVGAWLQQAPQARFLVTSRRPLGLEGERLLDLAPLPEADAVTLFIERASAVDAGFEADSAARARILEIVNRIDRMSLAIELAASRVAVLGLDEIQARLDQRFRLLRSSRRDLPPRQATLLGAIDWSWNLLAPWERSALAQAAVFHGGFTLEAFEAVATCDAWPDAPWPMDIVQSLVEHSLVRGLDPVGGRRRFGMYESIREYAAAKMAAADAVIGPADQPQTGAAALAALRRRHAQFYGWLGSTEAIDALDTEGGVPRRRALTREHQNLLVALDWAIENGEADTAARLAVAASYNLETSGPFSAGLQVVADAMTCEPNDPRLTIRLLERRGWLLALSGRIDEALDVQHAGLARAQEHGAKRREGILLTKIGDIHLKKGDISTALECQKAALAINRDVGDRANEGVTLGCLGLVQQSRGRMTEAVACFEASLAIHREVGHRRAEGLVLGNLGVVEMEQGRPEVGSDYYRQALAIHRETGNRRFEGVLMGNLAIRLLEEGHTDDARNHFERALAIHREVGNRRGEGLTLANLGELLQGAGETTRAAEYYVQAIAICDEAFPAAAGSGRSRLAIIRAQSGRFDDARALLERAEEQVRDVHATETGKLLCRRGHVELMAGEVDDALDALAEASSIAEQLEAGDESSLRQAIAQLRELLD